MPVSRKRALTQLPVETLIRQIRGHKIMLDSDLAQIYGVETKVLNQAVRRNLSRFPPDFMFQLSAKDVENLRSQFVTSSGTYGGRRYLPYAFTEHGVVMLSSVLNSKRAAQMNIIVVRAFVRMREIMASHKDLATRIEKLENNRDKTASVIEILAEDIEQLNAEIHWIKNPPLPKKHRMGFFVEKESDK